MAGKKRSLRLVGKNEPITLDSVVGQSAAEVHPSQLDFEDEFEALLDAEGDAEFGAVEFRDPTNAQREVLKNWTSQDFANIYTRFRPHLERYGRRFLSNQHQIDEVVQDAFLYLMVTLPELDSELGVLRFLKWKLRLLCLDVQRASGKAYINNIDDHQDALVSSEPEHSAALEAADDAAVVRLALSKLTPRHREVLLATMYEEKSISQIAAQVELSENATRQLLHRARAAFKVALIGDVDTSGMSAGAILSVAARKAAQETKKVGVQLTMALLMFVLGVGTFLSFGNGGAPGANVANPAPEASDKPVVSPSHPSNGSQASHNGTDVTDSTSGTTTDQPAQVDGGTNTESVANLQPAPSESPLNVYALNAQLNSGVTQEVVVFPSAVKTAGTNLTNYTVTGSANGLTASFAYDAAAQQVRSIKLVMIIDGVQFTAYGSNVTTYMVDGQMVVTTKILDLIDPQNVVLSNTEMSGATVTLRFTQADLTGGMQNASLVLAAAKK